MRTLPHCVLTSDPAPRQNLALSSRRRTPSVVVSAKMICGQLLGVRGLTQHRQQRARAVLLHLHRHGENVERAFLKQPVHHVAKHLRIQIVQVRLEHDDGVFAVCLGRSLAFLRPSAAARWHCPGSRACPRRSRLSRSSSRETARNASPESSRLRRPVGLPVPPASPTNKPARRAAIPQ